ncbi:BON domain-containing protein [Legionella micdadei]|uniref:BON domain-containing protein n=1 Tax=Legionella micdadei TaxID=451 RepID=A0A098GDZ7_LEGMI|nr:BON domain-containing protein [Legionella micdadei]KTD30025.1 phospholipid binding protein [Legionella micdadei]NSL18596.1 BON domain-containing protein [Legionella micdadei]CEG60217.1 Phospholipid-binding domain-containing protein [Legionella micdadei]SCY58489.1 BON domain-containing protein [Legionella micdadei]
MKKYYLNGLIGFCLAILVGCQSLTHENFFRVGPSDETITTSVQSAFSNNPDLSAQRIHVETHKGTVVLSGYVKTIRQSDTAGDIAGKISGVKSVQNELIVRK